MRSAPLGLLVAGLLGASAIAATPSEQQAIVVSGPGGPDALHLQSVPVPKPGDHQLLIRVYAAAVNPVDWKTPPPVSSNGKASIGLIPGKDVAGIVEQLGTGVTGLKPGDPVFAIIPAPSPDFLNGAYAQFALVGAGNAVLKPRNLTYAQAAGLGVAGVTGVRAVDAVKVSKGQRVLITGVAGGVGSFAAQAAKARGAYVIGTASARHNAYLHSIGVDEVIDYTQVKFEDQVKNPDVVIDTVGGDTAERAMTTLKKGSLFISIAARGIDEKCAAAGIVCMSRGSVVDVDHAVYEKVAALASAGQLKVRIDRTFPLAQAAAAQKLSEEGHTEGKIILIVDAAHATRK